MTILKLHSSSEVRGHTLLEDAYIPSESLLGSPPPPIHTALCTNPSHRDNPCWVLYVQRGICFLLLLCLSCYLLTFLNSHVAYRSVINIGTVILVTISI